MGKRIFKAYLCRKDKGKNLELFLGKWENEFLNHICAERTRVKIWNYSSVNGKTNF